MNKRASSHTPHKIKPEHYVTSVSVTDVFSARNGLRYCHVKIKVLWYLIHMKLKYSAVETVHLQYVAVCMCVRTR